MNRNLKHEAPIFIIATTNDAKASEIQRALAGRIRTIRATCQLPIVNESADSLHGNALLKARSAMHATGMPALADDTALEIDALSGRPGLYTARFARLEGSFAAATSKLLQELEGFNSAKRTARFRTAAAAVLPDGKEATAWGAQRAGGGGGGWGAGRTAGCGGGEAEEQSGRWTGRGDRRGAVRRCRDCAGEDAMTVCGRGGRGESAADAAGYSRRRRRTCGAYRWHSGRAGRRAGRRGLLRPRSDW